MLSPQLTQLLDDGVVDEIVQQIKSGKEADVFLVRKGEQLLAAKVYKAREQRNFKNNSGYKEGRVARNSRDQRAMDKGSKFGREQSESAWKSAEVDALYKLQAAGVRVPAPNIFYEGVLVMELVVDHEGQPAPRLSDCELTHDDALLVHHELLRMVVLMLTCDLIHGDLSGFNVLLAHDGPTIIDLPQVVSAAHNSQAEIFLKRDVKNVTRFLALFAPELLTRPDGGDDIWKRYTRGELFPGYVPDCANLKPEPPPPPPRVQAPRPPQARRGPPGPEVAYRGPPGQPTVPSQPPSPQPGRTEARPQGQRPPNPNPRPPRGPDRPPRPQGQRPPNPNPRPAPAAPVAPIAAPAPTPAPAVPPPVASTPSAPPSQPGQGYQGQNPRPPRPPRPPRGADPRQQQRPQPGLRQPPQQPQPGYEPNGNVMPAPPTEVNGNVLPGPDRNVNGNVAPRPQQGQRHPPTQRPPRPQGQPGQTPQGQPNQPRSQQGQRPQGQPRRPQGPTGPRPQQGQPSQNAGGPSQGPRPDGNPHRRRRRRWD